MLTKVLVPNHQGGPDPTYGSESDNDADIGPDPRKQNPWKRIGPGLAPSRLNAGQRKALEGMTAPAVVVQGPPGTGKSSFITQAILQRIPSGGKVLACTSTNKAIDSLVEKLVEAGVEEILCVGRKESMGAVSKQYLLSERLSRDPLIKVGSTDQTHVYEMHVQC